MYIYTYILYNLYKQQLRSISIYSFNFIVKEKLNSTITQEKTKFTLRTILQMHIL